MEKTDVAFIVFCSVSALVALWAMWRAHRKGMTVGKIISSILEDIFSSWV